MADEWKKTASHDCGKGGLGCDCCNTTRPRRAAGPRKARRKGAKQITRAVRHKLKRAVREALCEPA